MSKTDRINELKQIIRLNAEKISEFKNLIMRISRRGIAYRAIKNHLPELERKQVEYEAELAQLTGTKNTNDV